MLKRALLALSFALVPSLALAQQGGGVVGVPPFTGCAQWTAPNILTGITTPCGGGGGVTWPATGDAVISNSTNSPGGVAPINGDCLVGNATPAWVAGSCGSTSPGGSSGDIQDNNGAGGFGASALNDNGTIIKSAESIDTKTNATVWEISNAASTGTTVNKLAFLTGAPSTALIQPTTTQIGALGIVIGGAGTTGSAQIAITGQASCVFDGATIAGHYVDSSTGTAGDCHDAGAGEPSAVTVVGIVLSTNGGAGTYGVSLFPPTENSVSGSSGLASKPCVSTPNSVQYGSNSTAVPTFACAPLIDNSGVMQFVGNNFTFSTGFELFSDSFGDNFFGGAYQSLSTSSYLGNLCSGYDNNGGVGFACAGLVNGSYNVGLGAGALRNTSTGTNNVGIGYRAGLNNTSGSGNVTIGYTACGGGSTGAMGNDTCIGNNAGPSVASSINSTLVGTSAGTALSGGSGDSCFGLQSCPTITSAVNAVCIGPYSCNGLTTGSYDISIATSSTGGGQTNCMSSATVSNEFDFCSNGAGDAGPILRCNIISLAAGSCVFNVPVTFPGYTVATLPVSPPVGSRTYVTDGVACVFNGVTVGGGTVVCPQFYNGTTWLAG